MFRFTIRDVLWLTVVVALALSWWLLWRSIQDTNEAAVSGSIYVGGQLLSAGHIYLHTTEGQIAGARVAKGEFRIPKLPVGTYLVTIDGEGVSSRYSAESSGLSVEVRRGVNRFDFDLP